MSGKNTPYALVELSKYQYDMMEGLIDGRFMQNMGGLQMIHDMSEERAARYRGRVEQTVEENNGLQSIKINMEKGISK